MPTKIELPVIEIPKHCYYCYSMKISRVKNIIGSGAYQVWDMCTECGKHAWGRIYYIPHKQTGMVLENIPLYKDYRELMPPCVVCHSTAGVELHHFAPRHIFGYEEAEKWPKEYLCKACHDEWHQKIALHNPQDCLYCKGLVTKGKANGKG